MAGAIALDVPLALAPKAARESMLRVLQTIGKPAGSHIELSLFLHDLHVAIAGDVSLPAALGVVTTHERWECSINIHAAADEGFFPSFAGVLRILPVEQTSVVRLQGEYQPPFGAIGALLDKTVLRHAAERSLKSFVQRIANDILEDSRN